MLEQLVEHNSSLLKAMQGYAELPQGLCLELY